jgi:predicted DNA-binding transcriptional regulator YafY
MPPRLRRRVDALRTATVPASFTGGPAVDPGVLTSVAQACRDAERLEFGYDAADGTRTDRLVEPFRLVPLGRRWYLVAYDLHRHDWRSFRLDRLDAPRRTGARFLPRKLPADDAAEFVRARLRSLPTPYEVEVLFDAPAEAVRARVGRWVTVEEAGEGRCRMRMSTDSLDWAALAVGSVPAEFTVLAPEELGAYLRGWGERFVRATS